MKLLFQASLVAALTVNTASAFALHQLQRANVLSALPSSRCAFGHRRMTGVSVQLAPRHSQTTRLAVTIDDLNNKNKEFSESDLASQVC